MHFWSNEGAQNRTFDFDENNRKFVFRYEIVFVDEKAPKKDFIRNLLYKLLFIELKKWRKANSSAKNDFVAKI